MAGYPPQQHYAAVHQPPHVAPYHVPGYPIHPPPSTNHHPYPSHLPGGAPFQSNYTAAPPPPPSQSAAGVGSNSGSSGVPHTHSQRELQQQQHHQHQHNMHHSHTASMDRGAGYDTHRNQSARPSSQAVSSQAALAGPSLSRSQYGNTMSASQQSSQASHHGVAPPPPHAHPLSSAPTHSQSHIHNNHAHNIHPHASYMHGMDYEQQPPPPQVINPGPRSMNQPPPMPPSLHNGSGGVGSNNKRSGAGGRDKEREGAVPTSRGAGGAKGGAGAKRGGQEKQSGTGGKQTGGAGMMDKNAASAMAATAMEEPMLESKKIRKRKEVVDRIHRVHWDALENRELLYHDMQHKLSMISTTLLLWPSNSRPYLMALHRLNLERDAQLRQSALLHAHQVESARMAFEQERNKVEDEARNSKRLVREKLLAAVEDRRRRLREDKESGEGMSDTLLDPSTRPHATRKLRNKGSSSSKRGVDSETGLAARVAMPGTNGGSTNAHGSLLGLLLSGGNGANGDGTSTPRGEGSGYLGGLTSIAEFNQLSGGQNPIASLPPSNFDSAANNAVSLLHLQGVGGGMGDSSYMSGTRVALQNQSKGKKKPGGKGSLANAGVSTGGAASGSAILNGHAVNASGGDDDEDGNGSNSRSVAAAAAAAAAAASLAIGTGRLRWDQGKSVGQLTSAKDIEIESDLINIRKTGNKRRRR